MKINNSKEEYKAILKVENGNVIDELNGATICNVYTIGLNFDYMIDCYDENDKLLGFFCYARNKQSWIHCEHNNYTEDIDLVYKGKINKEIWE